MHAHTIRHICLQPKYLEILMPPLISKWQLLPDNDKDLFPLLECFTSIAQVQSHWLIQLVEDAFVGSLDKNYLKIFGYLVLQFCYVT